MKFKLIIIDLTLFVNRAQDSHLIIYVHLQHTWRNPDEIIMKSCGGLGVKSDDLVNPSCDETMRTIMGDVQKRNKLGQIIGLEGHLFLLNY